MLLLAIPLSGVKGATLTSCPGATTSRYTTEAKTYFHAPYSHHSVFPLLILTTYLIIVTNWLIVSSCGTRNLVLSRNGSVVSL